MFKTYSTKLAGRDLTIESGKIAGLANGSVVVRYGDTVVMVNVTASKEPRDGIDFFPLSVDYEDQAVYSGRQSFAGTYASLYYSGYSACRSFRWGKRILRT